MLKKKGDVWVLTMPKKNPTLKEFISYLADHSETLLEYPFEIEISGANTLKQQKLFEHAIQCFYLVTKFYSVKMDSLFPSQVQDASNFQQQLANLSWGKIPYYQKYVNASLNIISDPEFMLIYFSKLLESFDSNCRALLPSYPKTILNQILPPNEIKEICYMVLLEWQIKGKRGNTKPLSKPQALEVFKTSFPSLYYLVLTRDGFHILTCAYHILTIIKKDENQSLETRKKCLNIYHQCINTIADSKLAAHFKKINRIGVFFTGMPNARVNPGCLLSMHLLYFFYYFPQENVYLVDATVQNYMKKIKREYYQRFPTNIYQYDVDKHSHKIKKQFTSDYLAKEYVRQINAYLGHPNYNLFLDSLVERIYCNTMGNKLLL